MNALLINRPEPKLLLESFESSAVLVEDLESSGGDSDCSFEAIRARAETVTPFLEEILHVRLSKDW